MRNFYVYIEKKLPYMFICTSIKSQNIQKTEYTRVCYLARARAMARAVLAQIEFARAICGSRKILPMLH